MLLSTCGPVYCLIILSAIWWLAGCHISANCHTAAPTDLFYYSYSCIWCNPAANWIRAAATAVIRTADCCNSHVCTSTAAAADSSAAAGIYNYRLSAASRNICNAANCTADVRNHHILCNSSCWNHCLHSSASCSSNRHLPTGCSRELPTASAADADPTASAAICICLPAASHGISADWPADNSCVRHYWCYIRHSGCRNNSRCLRHHSCRDEPGDVCSTHICCPSCCARASLWYCAAVRHYSWCCSGLRNLRAGEPVWQSGKYCNSGLYSCWYCRNVRNHHRSHTSWSLWGKDGFWGFCCRVYWG